MRVRSLISTGLAVAAAAVLAAPALAVDGELDPSFGGDGRVVSDPTPVEESVSDLVVDSQGRIVVVGSGGSPSRAYIARFTASGELDESFSDDGWAFIGWTAESEDARSVTIDSQGRLVVGGLAAMPVTGFDFAAARFTVQGDLDAAFSGDGRVTAHVLQGGTDLGNGVATDAQDRVLVAGLGGTRMAVARFTAGGVLDPSFGVDEGTQPIGFPGYETSSGKSIAVDSSGRIVVAGTALSPGLADFGVVRLLGADGEFDAGFGSQGRATLSFGSETSETLTDMTIDGEGRYLLTGAQGSVLSSVTLIGRLLDSGSPDASFDADGKAISSPGEPSFAKGVATDAAGRVLAAGAIGGLGQDGALFRLDPNGGTDAGFGSGGLVRDDYLAANATMEGVDVDGAGRYVVAGNATAGGTSRIGLARFMTSYPVAPAPPAPPAPAPPPAGAPTPPPAPHCKGAPATKTGTAKRDVIRGTNKRDVIVALGGDDLIKGRGGNDLICAGAGEDVVRAGAGNDRVFGGGGRDRLYGEGGRDRLLGEAGRDVLQGGPGRDAER